jgi:cell shape-determining protein MreD
MRGVGRWGFPILIGLLVVLHFVLRIGMGFGALAPDLLVVAVLLAARRMRAGNAAGLGFVLGLLEGAMVPVKLGASALVLVLLGFLGARTRDLIASDSAVFLAFYLFAGKWLFDVMLAVVTGGIFRGTVGNLLFISPLEAIYAAAAGVVAVAVYRVVE